MDSLIKKLQFIADKLNVASSIIAIVTFATMSVVVCAQVISRCFFTYSFQWAEEFGRYLFIWSTMFASACATYSHLNIGVDILVENLKGKTQFAFKLVAQVFLITAVYILMVYGTQQALDVFRAGQTATSLPLSAGILYLSVPLSGALMLFFTLLQLLELFFYGEFRKNKVWDFLGRAS